MSRIKLLAKYGASFFCKNIKKDFELLRCVNSDGIAWLSIPNVCYAPVMKSKQGYYKNHNYAGRENAFGEIHVSDDKTARTIKKLSLDNNDSTSECITDLTIISGSPYCAGSDLRHSNFSNLRSYAEAASQGVADDIELCDINGVHKYKMCMCIYVTKGASNTGFNMSSREDLLNSLKKLANWAEATVDFSNNILLIRYHTNIDNMTLVFYAKS